MNLQNTSENNSKVISVANSLTAALFTVYLVALCWILLFKLGVHFSYMAKRSVNFIPFSALISNGKAELSEIISNVVIFVPLGIYIGILFDRWNFGRKLFFVFLISLIVEALQFTLAIGAFDITDIITNTFGGIIGLMIFKAIEKIFNNGLRAQYFINVIATTGTVLMILLLVLLKLNMLPIRYQ
jgi:glycopeptide antibiotics resistance protein